MNALGFGSLTSSIGAAVPSPGAWTQVAKLVASDGEKGDAFGTSVALDGDTAVVGANGKAYVFVDTGGGWSQQAILTIGDAESP